MRHRVISTHLDFWVEPSRAFVALCSGPGPAFWLDSGSGARDGVSALGLASRFVTTSGTGLVREQPSGVVHEGTIFDFLRREQSARLPSMGEHSFPIGWVGWLGYELFAQSLDIAVTEHSQHPDAAFLLADRVVAFDHRARTVSLIALGESWVGSLGRWREETIRTLSTVADGDEVAAPVRAPPAESDVEPVWSRSEKDYLAAIVECQERIRAGDAYQLCLTNEISVRGGFDAVQTYLRLREVNPSHHSGFVRIGDVCLLSSSPEQFLAVSPEGRVRSRPIKGTRRRGATPQEDGALRAELLASDKERAENLMIVDLVRNDLSRVCEVGSVSVPHLFALESYASVHQLVSTVAGTLSSECDPVDAVVACFPAGSMTGAPKISAVAILQELERRPRGIYAGAFGYFGMDGSIDLAMVIRSIVLDGTRATIGTGGGITALSIPAEEVEETRIKADALLRALGLVTL